ncbi:MAG: phosphoribosylglycinamide formyltransferase [Chloroflexota bacterium]
MGQLRVGVLVSGRGSNLQALLDATASGNVAAEIAVVVSNHAEAYALERAHGRGVPTFVAERSRYASRAAQQRAIAETLVNQDVQLVVLAGYDRILGPEILGRFPMRVLNIHPSLLPAFGGSLRAQAEALDHGVKVSGCTVHFVTGEVDGGPIVLQAVVPVLEDDTVETLAERILRQEHVLLPKAVDLFARGRLVVEGRRVRVV